jgi:hypothetical protein
MEVARIEVDGKVYVEEKSIAQFARCASAAARAIPVAARVETKALDYCLDVWLRWQRQDDTRLGWRGKSAMLESDYTEDEDIDSAAVYSDMDTRVAEAVEAVMRGLPRYLDWAIRRRCSVATVWRFPSIDFVTVLPEAEAALENLLRKNIATRSLFV